jgi:hypothetical protein
MDTVSVRVAAVAGAVMSTSATRREIATPPRTPKRAPAIALMPVIQP